MKFPLTARKNFKILTRRLTIIELFVLFVCTALVLTGFLYGLIEIDSNKLVINLNPLAKNQKLDVRSVKNLHRYERVNDYGDFQQVVDHKKLSDSQTTIKNSIENKNISKLFFTVERFAFKIEKLLQKSEIDRILALKTKIEKALAERERILENEMRLDKEGVNKNDDEDDDTGNDSDKEFVLTQLAPSEHITREEFIMLLRLEKNNRKMRSESTIKTVKQLVDEFDQTNEMNLSELPNIWKTYFFSINEFQLFNDTNVVNKLLQNISQIPVMNCYEKDRGTQIKLILLLADGTEVLVKPMRVPRDYITPPDHFYFVDFERHHAEIAAFHVDKLLGFNRVPPTVGRVFNMSTELWEKAEGELAKTFFISPGNNVCFTGHCSYYCDTTHAICGKPRDRMEGSVQLMLPRKPLVNWKVSTHPYKRTYNKKKKAEWETNEKYCEQKVFQDITYHSKLFLDLIDMAIFDFMIGNMDRHHYEQMISLGNLTFPIHLDNGRAFGKTQEDEMSILAPLKQCCLVRYSTFLRLKHLHQSKFSKLMDESLKSDPLYPILTQPHLDALDRRIEIIFDTINRCIDAFTPTQVIVDDGF